MSEFAFSADFVGQVLARAHRLRRRRRLAWFGAAAVSCLVAALVAVRPSPPAPRASADLVADVETFNSDWSSAGSAAADEEVADLLFPGARRVREASAELSEEPAGEGSALLSAL